MLIIDDLICTCFFPWEIFGSPCQKCEDRLGELVTSERIKNNFSSEKIWVLDWTI